MSDMDNKLTNSAHQLGVMLGIPMYVDPEKGFEAEKILTWENGDKIKVNVIWADGAYYYTAYLGQIDPKTNEMAFISGKIAEANSLESLIGMVDGFLKDKALERGEVETVVEPDVTVPQEIADEAGSDDVVSDEQPVDIADDLINDYQAQYSDYQDLLMDPEHDHDKVREISNSLASLEMKLREQGIHPTEIKK